jgi:two-component system, response regulator PdtaR
MFVQYRTKRLRAFSYRKERVVFYHRYSVLVVEDEPLILLALVDELTDLGFEVFEAANARAAIRQLTLNPSIEVMFTDIDMPGDMDGLQLAALVRSRWPPIKIIVTSGKHLLNHDELPVIGRFMAKPYDPAIVAATIYNVMTR